MDEERHPIRSLDNSAGIHSLGNHLRRAIGGAIHETLVELMQDMPEVNASEVANAVRQELINLAENNRHAANIRNYILDEQADRGIPRYILNNVIGKPLK